MAGAGIFIGIFGLVFYLFILLLPVALLMALQVWLCKKNLKLGLILPVLSLLLSLFIVFSIPTYTTVGGSSVRAIDENGQIVEIPDYQYKVGTWSEMKKLPNVLPTIVIVFLASNIPTVVFGGIWLHYKGRKDTADDLKRMKIEDLE